MTTLDYDESSRSVAYAIKRLRPRPLEALHHRARDRMACPGDLRHESTGEIL